MGYSISNFYKVHQKNRFCWNLAHTFYNIKLRYPENFSSIGSAVWKLWPLKDHAIWRKKCKLLCVWPWTLGGISRRGYESITLILPQYLYHVGGYLPTKNYLGPGTPSLRNKPFCFMSDITPWFTLSFRVNQG